MSSLKISVILPTHNPHAGRLEETLEGLKSQELDRDLWELLIVDNASAPGNALEDIGLAWHPSGVIVREEELGLTHARLCGIAKSSADVLLFCDDDNILQPDYLSRAVELFESEDRLGIVGGRSIPRYEVTPPEWFPSLGIALGTRDLGDEPMREEWSEGPADGRMYPSMAPIGAGMCFRRRVGEQYIEHCRSLTGNVATDRKGDELVSGGDNDLVMTALERGWRIGYEPGLRLTHIIPEGRLKTDYLARLNHDSTKSFVLVLDMHGIRHWKPILPLSLPFRKSLSYFRHRAWRGPEEHIRWRGSCGLFEGAALLKSQ